MIDAVAAVLDAASGLVGWRSVAGLICGAFLAGALYFLGLPAHPDIRPLIVVVAFCFLVGAFWDFMVLRARQRSVP